MSLSSVSGKNWVYKKFNSTEVSQLAEKYSVTETVAKLLSIRKKNIDNIDLFLNPKIKNLLPNPMQLKDMKNAVDRVYKSISNNELIGIFGDYDVDGATSTAVLARYFLSINQKIKTYIPDRQKEGYGPSIDGFLNLINQKGFYINNIDINVITERPKISKYRNKIIDSISKLCNINKNQINIKGKTSEKLGLIGKEKAIACEVIASVIKYA